MINYQLLFLINILFIFGIHVCFKEEMIFEKAADWIEEKVKDHYWLKPLYSCPICMSSIWGGACFIIFSGLSIFLLPVWVISMAGANYIILQLISKHIEVSIDKE